MRSLFVVLVVLAAPLTTAQERLHEHGHPEELGRVDFATSCNDPAQQEFNRAVALLHSFQFSSAIEGFTAALQQDETCGIAYWGISLSDWSNPFAPGNKDSSQLQAGLDSAKSGERVGAHTDRERAYLSAVGKLYENFERTPQPVRQMAYRDAMEKVASDYPQDHEAQIFYALALAASEDPSDKTYAGRLRAGSILENLFESEPTHPGLAHYIIHAYDVPALAPHALGAARRYAQIAPDAPHALHMPSHTFTRLGYWQESIDSNVAAATAARREGQAAEELHASDYEVYAYLQVAEDEAAERIANALPDIASRFDPNTVVGGAGGPAAGYFALAAIPARFALERRDWAEAEALNVRETPFPYTDAITWFARGLGAARLGHFAAAHEAVAALQRIQGRLSTMNEPYWKQQVEIQKIAVAAWADLAAHKRRAALWKMHAAANMEDDTEKSALTPGPLAPARELLAEMWLELNEPIKALAQFQATLTKEPGRFRSLYGAAHAAQLSHRGDSSRAYFRELLRVCRAADSPLRAELVEAERAITRR